MFDRPHRPLRATHPQPPTVRAVDLIAEATIWVRDTRDDVTSQVTVQPLLRGLLLVEPLEFGLSGFNRRFQPLAVRHKICGLRSGGRGVHPVRRCRRFGCLARRERPESTVHVSWVHVATRGHMRALRKHRQGTDRWVRDPSVGHGRRSAAPQPDELSWCTVTCARPLAVVVVIMPPSRNRALPSGGYEGSVGLRVLASPPLAFARRHGRGCGSCARGR